MALAAFERLRALLPIGTGALHPLRYTLAITTALCSTATLADTLLLSQSENYRIAVSEMGLTTPPIFSAEFQPLDPALAVGDISVVLTLNWVIDFDFWYVNQTAETQKAYFTFSSMSFYEAFQNGIKDGSLGYGPLMVGLSSPATVLDPGESATLDVTYVGSPGPRFAQDASRYVGADPLFYEIVAHGLDGSLELNDSGNSIRCPAGPAPCPYTFDYIVTGTVTLDYYLTAGSGGVVPLPGAGALFLSGLAGIRWIGRRRRVGVG